MRRLAWLAAIALLTTAQAPALAPDMKLWRLDCGELDISDFGAFSDAHRFDGQPRKMVDSCYLVKHGDRYLLWDTGLPGELADAPAPAAQGIFAPRVRERVRAQLARIGVTPAQVTFVGISHHHGDHTGQAADFPAATLLIGAQDLDTLRAAPPVDRDRIAPWLGEGAKVTAIRRDHDVFGDKRVITHAMPGHTGGHHTLLVRLPKTGAVLLSGDLWHSATSYAEDTVPIFNTDRADTLASFDRFRDIAKNLRARVIIQHEPADVRKLPAFPAAAE